VRWAALWALGLLALSEAFLYRLSMPRAQAASLLVLVLALHWLLTERYWALLPLGMAYVWLYDAFPLLLVAAGVYVAAQWAAGQAGERRVTWQPLAYAAAGLALGLVVNPYFPQNISFIGQHLAPKLGGLSTPVGNEWYPYETWTLVANSGPALAAFVLGTLAMGWRGQRPNRAVLTSFGLSVVFGFMLFKSRRFIEYYPAFALLFLALSAAPVLNGWVAAAQARWGQPSVERRAAGQLAVARRAAGQLAVGPTSGGRRYGVGGRTLSQGLIAAALPLALAAGLAGPLVGTLQGARAAMARSKPATLYAGASGWLRANTPPGSLVFQTDWDDFPRLFFYNPNNLYTVGLDPTYLSLYDAALYAEWVDLTQGKQTPPGPAIRADFGAEYVLTDKRHGDFLRVVADDPTLKEVYRDDEAVVYQVLQ
jgi:hypothetical protein